MMMDPPLPPARPPPQGLQTSTHIPEKRAYRRAATSMHRNRRPLKLHSMKSIGYVDEDTNSSSSLEDTMIPIKKTHHRARTQTHRRRRQLKVHSFRSLAVDAVTNNSSAGSEDAAPAALLPRVDCHRQQVVATVLKKKLLKDAYCSNWFDLVKSLVKHLHTADRVALAGLMAEWTDAQNLSILINWKIPEIASLLAHLPLEQAKRLLCDKTLVNDVFLEVLKIWDPQHTTSVTLLCSSKQITAALKELCFHTNTWSIPQGAALLQRKYASTRHQGDSDLRQVTHSIVHGLKPGEAAELLVHLKEAQHDEIISSSNHPEWQKQTRTHLSRVLGASSSRPSTASPDRPPSVPARPRPSYQVNPPPSVVPSPQKRPSLATFDTAAYLRSRNRSGTMDKAHFGFDYQKKDGNDGDW